MSALIGGEGAAMGRRRAQRLRVLALAATAMAVLLAAGGAAYAYLTLQGSGSGPGDFASTGSVTIGTPVSTTCNYATLVPGELPALGTCSFSVTYSGSLPAYMSLTVQVQSKAGSGGRTLYDPPHSSGLTISISDGHNAFTVPAGTGTTVAPCPAGFTCWATNNDLAAAYSGNTPNLTFTNGNSATFTITPSFPKGVGNFYQGATASVTLIAQAVQTGANTINPACTTSTIGQPCPATASFMWSS